MNELFKLYLTLRGPRTEDCITIEEMLDYVAQLREGRITDEAAFERFSEHIRNCYGCMKEYALVRLIDDGRR